MWAGFLAPVHRTKVPGSSLPHCWGPPHTKRPTGCSCRRATAGALRRACAPQVHPAPNPASAGCLKSSNICCIHAKRLQLTVATPWNRSTVQTAWGRAPMRTKILALVYALSFLLFDVPPAMAATIGAAQKLQPGDTVDFGTAIMGADPASINCALGAPCIISGRLPHVDAFFLTDGVGPSDGRIIQDLTSFWRPQNLRRWRQLRPAFGYIFSRVHHTTGQKRH